MSPKLLKTLNRLSNVSAVVSEFEDRSGKWNVKRRVELRGLDESIIADVIALLDALEVSASRDAQISDYLRIIVETLANVSLVISRFENRTGKWREEQRVEVRGFGLPAIDTIVEEIYGEHDPADDYQLEKCHRGLDGPSEGLI